MDDMSITKGPWDPVVQLWQLVPPSNRFSDCLTAAPWALGSCVVEHVTCQLMVGNFRQLGPTVSRGRGLPPPL